MKKNLKIFLLFLLVATISIVMTNVVFATEIDDDLFNFTEDSGAESTPTPSGPSFTTATPTPTYAVSTPGTISNTPTPTPVRTIPTATPSGNTSVYNNTDLPKAGASDNFVIIAVMVVFGAIAVFAYKKIKDYNI